MALFTTALGLYGGVLWCGELQGFIIHEMMPSRGGKPPTVHSALLSNLKEVEQLQAAFPRQALDLISFWNMTSKGNT
jgi:hypothetical protein